ncbi:P-loop containing nucleoside triphosphate hydrolase protein [Syncephalis plumigaleata]|nr:P-loop containing nucleoside triphosphate hydrolase protein [Syncephalis plumigaleata]
MTNTITTLQQLVNELVEVTGNLPQNKRYILGIAGVPGSGKTWLAQHLVNAINEEFNTTIAVALSMDGFHLTKEQLRAMPDPEMAFCRRGSAWTFDANGFAMAVELLTSTPIDKQLTWPSFDHAIGDPIPDDITIQSSQRIIIIEGLYLALDELPWSQVPYDNLWLIRLPDCQIAYDRLIRRHQEAGLAKNAEQAQQRIEQNDQLNAQHVLSSYRKGTRIIELPTITTTTTTSDDSSLSH